MRPNLIAMEKKFPITHIDIIIISIFEQAARCQMLKDGNKQNQLKRHFMNILVRCHDLVLEKVAMDKERTMMEM